MRLLLRLAIAFPLAPALAQNVLYETTFETDAGWTMTSNQADYVVDDVRPPNGALPPSLPNSLRFTEHGFTTGWSWGVGAAGSPVIDLTGASTPQLTFWLFWMHEIGCTWDELALEITNADTGQLLYDECLSITENSARERWSQFRRALDPSWGRIRIWFTYDAWDFGNFSDWGFLVDDLRVLDDSCGTSTLCVPAPQADSTAGPRLSVAGQPTSTSANLRAIGSGFPPHTFAAGFLGPDTAVLPLGNGIRCVAGGTSVRLPVAPTRASGTPWWTLDLTDPGLVPMIQVGQPVFLQAYYRDGTSFNFSEALRIDVCQ